MFSFVTLYLLVYTSVVLAGKQTRFYNFGGGAGKKSQKKFAATIPRSFGVRYNPYTQNIEVLDTKLQIENLISTVNYDMQVLLDALRKL